MYCSMGERRREKGGREKDSKLHSENYRAGHVVEGSTRCSCLSSGLWTQLTGLLLVPSPGQRKVQGGLGQDCGSLGRTKDLEPRGSLS